MRCYITPLPLAPLSNLLQISELGSTFSASRSFSFLVLEVGSEFVYDEEKSLRFQNVLGSEGKTLTRWGT